MNRQVTLAERERRWRTPSARSPWTRSRRRSPGIPGCRWAWPTSRRCCSTASSSSTRPTRRGRTATGSCCRPGTARCCSTRSTTCSAMPTWALDQLKALPPARQPAPPGIRSTATRSASRRRPGRSGRGSRRRSAWRSPSGCRRRGSAGLVDHFTWVIAGDGCLMEGISQEAIDLAGHLRLGRLVVLWDDNRITIDGDVGLSTSIDQAMRFRASGWQVQEVDGHDPDAVAAAIAVARALGPADDDRLPDGDRLWRADQAGRARRARRAARGRRDRGGARAARLEPCAVRDSRGCVCRLRQGCRPWGEREGGLGGAARLLPSTAPPSCPRRPARRRGSARRWPTTRPGCCATGRRSRRARRARWRSRWSMRRCRSRSAGRPT